MTLGRGTEIVSKAPRGTVHLGSRVHLHGIVILIVLGVVHRLNPPALWALRCAPIGFGRLTSRQSRAAGTTRHQNQHEAGHCRLDRRMFHSSSSVTGEIAEFDGSFPCNIITRRIYRQDYAQRLTILRDNTIGFSATVHSSCTLRPIPINYASCGCVGRVPFRVTKLRQEVVTSSPKPVSVDHGCDTGFCLPQSIEKDHCVTRNNFLVRFRPSSTSST